MLKSTILAIALALTTVLAGLPAEAEPDNGIVMMVHLHAEPGPNDVSPFFVPPAQEAIVGTVEDDSILVHAIPYGTDTGRPVVVDDAALVVMDATGVELLTVTSTLDPSSQDICIEETGLPGHEGPIAACKVFAIDAEDLTGVDVLTLKVTFELNGRPGSETYNLVAHYLIHANIEGDSPMSMQDADATFHEATPVVVETLVDPVA